MAVWLQKIQSFRYGVVAIVAFLALSLSFWGRGNEKLVSPIPVRVDALSDRIAGLPAELKIYGEAHSRVELSIEKPDDREWVLQSTMDSQGEAYVVLSEDQLQMSGEYMVRARDLDANSVFGSPMSFLVLPSSVSETQSYVGFNKNSAQVGETVDLRVSLSDAYGNPIEGHIVSILPQEDFVQVYSPEFATDENGQMHFYVSSDQKGVYEFTIHDSSLNKTLSFEPKIAFSGSSRNPLAGLDSEVYDDFVVLAEDSGPVTSFILSGLDPTLSVGEDSSLTVKAVDESGFTVTDYTGTVRFSSTDSKATLPSDYSFLAEDQGEHRFSLAVKFVTPGNQTLTVTDVDQTSVMGEVEVEVVTVEDSGVDYDSDFESMDFEREGTFTLISPVEGSYSSDTVEIQGEAEYGYTAVIYLDEEEVGRTEVDFDNSFTFSLHGLNDGDYELYVDVVEVGEGEPGKEEILEIMEQSDVVDLSIDGTPPELASISADPQDNLSPSASVTITVLTESDLEEVSLILEEEIYAMDETPTSGKYEVNLTLPSAEGEYHFDVLLRDMLGNEVQYRDQLVLQVGNVTAAQSSGLEKVTGLTATGVVESVLLAWEAPETSVGIVYYRVYYGPTADSLYAVSETLDSSTHWSILKLDGEESYYFSVSAVDVEGQEGDHSDVVMGVPLLGQEAPEPVDSIDDTSPTPPISGYEDDVSATPETGPTEWTLLALSIVGAGILVMVRKRVQIESF